MLVQRMSQKSDQGSKHQHGTLIPSSTKYKLDLKEGKSVFSEQIPIDYVGDALS